MKSKGRNVLGRGLDALIPTGPAGESSAGFIDVDIDRITPNTWQPRDHFAPEALAELAQSIRENGVIQPIVVRPHGADFQLVAGERRWRAAQLAGLRRIPAVIKSISDNKLLEVALVENIQRQDLSPLETAKAFRLLIDEHSLTQDALSTRVGMKRSSVANYIRLLTLPEPVRAALDGGRIDMGHARALAGLEAPADQVDACESIVRGGLSVRQAEALVQRLKDQDGIAAPVPGKVRRDPNIMAAEKSLQKALGTRVKIVLRPRGTGKIEILFKSEEELQRLYAFLADDQVATSGAQ